MGDSVDGITSSARPGRRADGFDQPLVLRESLRRMSAARGVVVFDLDSTLLDNRPRQARIVRELGLALRDERLQGCKAEDWSSWDIADTLSRLGLTRQELEGTAPVAKAFWRERFFTSEYCAIDVPVAGGPAFASAVAATGITLCYVTGRHEEMRQGSVASFVSGGYPLPDGERIHLMMKPQIDIADDTWKRDVAGILRSMGGPVTAFDNEPIHINGYKLDFPQCYAVHLDTDHSGRPVEVLADIPSIRDFRLPPERE
jgi:hypothetical protein